MAVRSTTRSCTVTSYWEYGQTGTTPSNPQTQTVTKTGVPYTQWWYRYGGVWEIDGSPIPASTYDGMTYKDSFTVTSVAPTPSHFAVDGTRYSTPGTGSGRYTGTVETGLQPIYGWARTQASIHSHSTGSVSFDDGDYAGQLPYKSCDGTNASEPNYTGSNGATATTTTSATTTYEGDIPAVADTTNPTISITSHSGVNAITVNWTAADNKALRATSTFAVSISGPGDNTLVHKGYLPIDARTHTFQSDGANNPFVVNAIYLTRVIVVDSSNNTAYVDRYVTYTKSKPTPPFAWTNTKTQNSQYNLTTAEWNAFLNRVNEFQEYKGKSLTTFVRTVTTGALPYCIPKESSYNAARTAIIAMTPGIAPPAAVTQGVTRITASHLNGIVTSLNSIP